MIEGAGAVATSGRIQKASSARVGSAWVSMAVGVSSFAVLVSVCRGGLDEEEGTVRTALESAATCLGERRANDALRELEAAREREPVNPWVEFYAGSAHLQLGNAYRALDAYDRALDILARLGDPDPQLAEAVRRQRRTARRQVFSFSLRSGIAYDTNVTFGGGGATGIQFISGRDDGKFGTSFRIDYAPVATEVETLAVGASVGSSWDFGVEEFNYQEYGASVRYGRWLSRHWSAALRYDYALTYLGNESFLSLHSLSPALTYHWRGTTSRLSPDATTVDYRFEPRDFLYETEPVLDRDGFANSVGIDQGFRLALGERRDWVWLLNAGYRFTSVSTEGTEFDRLVHAFHLGVGVPLRSPVLPEQPLTFRFDANWEIADYRNESRFDRDRDERSDLITNLRFLLSQRVFDDVELGELTVHAIVDWTMADSNVTTRGGATPFTYDKVVYGIELEWSF